MSLLEIIQSLYESFENCLKLLDISLKNNV